MVLLLRKNNKILINFCNLRESEKTFFLDEVVLIDLLKNVEVVQMYKNLFLDKYGNIFDNWNGNLILI